MKVCMHTSDVTCPNCAPGTLAPHQQLNPFGNKPFALTDDEVRILRQMIAERQTNVEELEAENASLKEDQRRLEWLVLREVFVREYDGYSLAEAYHDIDLPWGDGKHQNWRDAIDAAMGGE